MIVGLIPARRGSKRVHNKAMRIVNGKPLLYWTMKAVEESRLERCYLTTDYDEETPGFRELIDQFPKTKYIKRPDELCQDASPASTYIDHFLGIPGMDTYSDICLLQPTCPLRRSDDINKAIKLYKQGSDSLISGYRIFKNYLYDEEIKTIYGTKLDKSKYVFTRNSAIYIFSTQYFKTYGTIFSPNPVLYEMDMPDSIDIDELAHLEACEKLLKG